MPIYEFCCGQCGKEFEEIVRSSTEKVTCPGCQSQEVQKQMSKVSFKSSGKFTGSSSSSSCSSCGGGSCSTCH
ncbi:MAG: zinc ribbon domain-containing protein [Deltaproteobacteria bacterium]|nr:zinc ribbon domain-containing protein [Deltaproteobacteria bacterium]